MLDSKVREAYVNPVYILSAVRTPIGKFGGSLASLSAADMGVIAAKAAIERAGVQAPQVEAVSYTHLTLPTNREV